MQKSKRTDDGWTVDDAPYFASEFDAARAMSVMTDEPTFVLPFHGVEDFPPESAPLAVKSAQATLNGLIDPVMFGPNITGDVWHIAGTSGTGIGGGESGAMYRTKHGGSDVPNGQTGGSSGYDGVAIDASKISSVYSSASTVQPSSLRTLMCIKT
jgi:hypothetical protein